MQMRKLILVVSFAALEAHAQFSWNLSKIPDPWVVSGWMPGEGQRCINFGLNTPAATAHLMVVSSTLVEQSTKKPLPANKFRICEGTEPCKENKPPDPQVGLHNYNLCLVDDFTTHGSFQGAVLIGAKDKPDGEQILKSILISSGMVKAAGFLIVLFGVFLAWASKVWARGRLDRLSAKQPIALLRQNYTALDKRIAKLPNGLDQFAKNTRAAVQKLRDDDLSDRKLDAQHLLPAKFPSPFGDAFDPARLKTFIEKTSADQQVISILVRGMEIAATIPAADPLKVQAAIGEIDEIVALPLLPAADAAQKAVQDAIDKAKPPAAQAAHSVQKPEDDPDRLQLQIEAVSGFVWSIWGLLTAAAALGVLILNNAGFGTPMDLLYCFFWGFGLPTVGQQLTPGSVATSLGVTVGKTS